MKYYRKNARPWETITKQSNHLIVLLQNIVFKANDAKAALSSIYKFFKFPGDNSQSISCVGTKVTKTRRVGCCTNFLSSSVGAAAKVWVKIPKTKSHVIIYLGGASSKLSTALLVGLGVYRTRLGEIYYLLREVQWCRKATIIPAINSSEGGGGMPGVLIKQVKCELRLTSTQRGEP